MGGTVRLNSAEQRCNVRRIHGASYGCGRLAPVLGVTVALSTNVPTGLVELGKPSWTPAKQAEDGLALCDHPTEAFHGQLEHLRGSALSFRNLSKVRRPQPPLGRRILLHLALTNAMSHRRARSPQLPVSQGVAGMDKTCTRQFRRPSCRGRRA